MAAPGRCPGGAFRLRGARRQRTRKRRQNLGAVYFERGVGTRGIAASRISYGSLKSAGLAGLSATRNVKALGDKVGQGYSLAISAATATGTIVALRNIVAVAIIVTGSGIAHAIIISVLSTTAVANPSVSVVAVL